MVFDHAYHGRTNLTMAMITKSTPYKSGFDPFNQRHLPRPHVLLASLEATNIACVVIEPIQDEGGFITQAPEFLPALRA